MAAGLVVYVLTASALYADFDAGLRSRARALVALSERSGAPHHIDLLPEVVADVLIDDLGYQLWAADGTLLAGSATPRTWAVVLADLGTAPGATRSESLRFDDGRLVRHLAVRCALRSDAGHAESVVIAVFTDASAIDHVLSRLGWLLVVVTLAVSALSAVVQAMAVHRGLRPLAQLAAEISRVGSDDLAHRFERAQRPHELAPVVERLNDLLIRLEAAFVRERRFSSAAAHELRTPLAGLRATLEVLQLDPAVDGRHASAIAACLAIIVQMERIVEALLLLARLDAGRVVPQAEPVELARLCTDAWTQVAAQAAARGLNVVWELSEDACCASDPRLLAVVVANLLGNAVAHADAGGDVRVHAAMRGGAVELTVDNSGSRVEAAEAERVFERFWRGDAARSGTIHHSGLGLALCRDIVAVLGGSIRVATSVGGRFVVTVTLPR
jgi:signal transduction histidine kinase